MVMMVSSARPLSLLLLSLPSVRSLMPRSAIPRPLLLSSSGTSSRLWSSGSSPSSTAEEASLPRRRNRTNKKKLVINADTSGVVASNLDEADVEGAKRPMGRLGVPNPNAQKRQTKQSSGRRKRRNNRRRSSQKVPPVPLPGQPGRSCYRSLVEIGAQVSVVQKQHQRSNVETLGIVQRHLTNSPYHPRGIKVMLTTNVVGRVTRLMDDDENESNGKHQQSE